MRELQNVNLIPEYIEKTRKQFDFNDGSVNAMGKRVPKENAIWSNSSLQYIPKENSYYDELLGDYIYLQKNTTYYYNEVDFKKVDKNIVSYKGNDKKFTIAQYALCSAYFIVYHPNKPNEIIDLGCLKLTNKKAIELGFEMISMGICIMIPKTGEEAKVYDSHQISPKYASKHIPKFDNTISPSKLNIFNKNYLLKMGVVSPSFVLTEGKHYTFGIELECATTKIDGDTSVKYNWLCTRDGSLNAGNGGAEFVTGVLQGDTGLHHLNRLLYDLAPVSTVDKYCGMHVHIGGFKFTHEFALTIHLICLKLQTNILSILPVSRRENEYCRKLKNIGISIDTSLSGVEYDEMIKRNYKLLYQYIGHKNVNIDGYNSRRASSPGIRTQISEATYRVYNINTGNFSDESQPQEVPAQMVNKTLPKRKVVKRPNSLRNNQHPMGAKCGYDHSTPRYEWLNLVPFLYNTRGNESYSIEFRPHSGSLNFMKIKNWILICMALIHYAENYSKEIFDGYYIENDQKKQLTLERVIYLAYPKKYNKILNYINSRIIEFSKPKSEQLEYDDTSNNIQSIKELCV